MGKKNEAMTAEHFEEVVSRNDHDAVGRMIAQGYLSSLSEKARTEAVQRIILLKDCSLIDQMVKKGITFTPEMVDIDISGNKNCDIINYVFKYAKHLDLSGEEKQNDFFEMACRTGSIPLLRHMTSRHMASGKYALLAAGNEEMADILLHLNKAELTGNLVVDIYVQAALTNDYQDRIPYLQKKGLDIKTTNDAGEDAAKAFRKYIGTVRYSKNKYGELTRKSHQNAGNYLYSLIHPAPIKEKPATEEAAASKDSDKSKRNRLIGIIAAVIIVCAIGGTAYGIHTAKAGSASEGTVSTEETVSETDTEITAE